MCLVKGEESQRVIKLVVFVVEAVVVIGRTGASGSNGVRLGACGGGYGGGGSD